VATFRRCPSREDKKRPGGEFALKPAYGLPPRKAVEIDDFWKEANKELNKKYFKDTIDGVFVVEATYDLSDAQANNFELTVREKTENSSVRKRREDFDAWERIRFWLKGDGSGNVMVVSCYDTKRNEWLDQAKIALDFEQWRHIEIPANNPVYYYYNTVTAFRFSFTNAGASKKQTGRILIGTVAFVNSEAVTSPLPKPLSPSPIMFSWGGANEAQIAAGAGIGGSMHSFPWQTEMVVRQLPSYGENRRMFFIPDSKRRKRKICCSDYNSPIPGESHSI